MPRGNNRSSLDATRSTRSTRTNMPAQQQHASPLAEAMRGRKAHAHKAMSALRQLSKEPTMTARGILSPFAGHVTPQIDIMLYEAYLLILTFTTLHAATHHNTRQHDMFAMRHHDICAHDVTLRLSETEYARRCRAPALVAAGRLRAPRHARASPLTTTAHAQWHKSRMPRCRPGAAAGTAYRFCRGVAECQVSCRRVFSDMFSACRFSYAEQI